jgi:autotransporter-associated beta strand protein
VARNYLLRGSSVVALGLAATLLGSVAAQAQCVTNGTNATCSGNVAGIAGGSGATNGFGDRSQNGLNIVVQPGATVTGAGAGGSLSDGISVNNNNQIGNFGIISGQDGITGVDGLKVTNAGTISSTAPNGVTPFAISAEHNLVLGNSATGNISGIASAFDGTITNLGAMGPIFFESGSGNAASTVINSGTITGIGGGSAIQFLHGSVGNTLLLDTTSKITGSVIGAGSDILQLDGAGTGTFNVSDIAAGQQYQGFTTFNKAGISAWTLTGSGALVFDQSFTGIYAGSISGTGNFFKFGAGNLTLTGNSAYIGETDVHGGTLQVDGSIALSLVVVDANAFLTGSSLGSQLPITRNVALFASFDGEFSDRSRMLAGKGGLKANW